MSGEYLYPMTLPPTSLQLVIVQSAVCCPVNPSTPTFCHMGTAIKHPVPDRVKPSFVIFDIWAL